jgi:hypothetical protein
MKKSVRLIIAVLTGVASTLVSAVPGSAEGGCRLLKKLEFNSTQMIVRGVNEYVCADPNRGHDNQVTVTKINPATMVTELTITGMGDVLYHCQGDDYRYFTGPGRTIYVPCS